MQTRCSHRAIAYVQHIGHATPACREHVAASGGRIFERISRLRACEFEAIPKLINLSEFAVVIAEAMPRCACGVLPEFCAPCARALRPSPLRPIVRAVARCSCGATMAIDKGQRAR